MLFQQHFMDPMEELQLYKMRTVIILFLLPIVMVQPHYIPQIPQVQLILHILIHQVQYLKKPIMVLMVKLRMFMLEKMANIL